MGGAGFRSDAIPVIRGYDNPMPSPRSVFVGALVAASLALPARATAQVRVLDEGSFTVFRGETRVGREDFSIRATADVGGPLAAQGTVAIETRRLQPALAATAAGTPVSYQLEIREGREVVARWALQIGGGRAVARERSARGESSTEFPAAAGALLFDEQVAHHAWFVLRRATAGTVPVIRPRDGGMGMIAITAAPADSVVVGGRTVAARRFVLRPDWGAPPREVWIDTAGRLLQVRIDGGGLRYLRDDAPTDG